MSQPTPYTPTTDFSQQEANNASGRSTVNTAALDAEFANIETTLDQTLDNLQKIQRDDGKLKDLAVGVNALSPEILNLMGGFRIVGNGVWEASIAYQVKDLASDENSNYVCIEAHTSGATFDPQYWARFGFTIGSDVSDAAASAAASAAAALSSANAAATSATNSANSATASANSASASSASAASALSAKNLALQYATQVDNSLSYLAVDATQAEMEAGTEAKSRAMSPLRVKQAIDALTPDYIWNIPGEVTASVTGTSFEAPSIPSWATKIDVVFNSVSLSANDRIRVQLYDSAYVTTGYVNAAGANSGDALLTSGMPITSGNMAASDSYIGIMRFERLSGSSHTWVQTNVGMYGSVVQNGSGSIALSSALTKMRVNMVSTASFDNGTITIKWR